MNDEQVRLLKTFIAELERLDLERCQITADMTETFKAMKLKGFDVKAAREVLRQRRLDESERQEQKATLETVDNYLLALGMLSDTPLGKAAVEREFGQVQSG